MATFTKQFLSAAGANNAPIVVTSATTLLHLPTLTSTEKDEMWIWLNNGFSTTHQVRVIWFNGTTSVDIGIFEIPPYTTVLAVPGLPMNSPNASSGVFALVLVGTSVRATGYVNRIA